MAVRESRTIEKSVFSPGSRKFFRLKSDQARLLFIGLVTVADDYGRLEGDADEIVATFPKMQLTTKTATEIIKDLVKVGLVTQYGVDGFKYIEINGFVEHQNWSGISSRGSKIPANPNGQVSTATGARDDGRNKEMFKAVATATTPESNYALPKNILPKPSEVVADTESGLSAEESFKEANRIFRRKVGKSLGNYRGMAYKWQTFVEKNGSAKTLAAIELYSQELGKNGRNLNYPMAHFLSQSDQWIDAVDDMAAHKETDPDEEVRDLEGIARGEANAARTKQEREDQCKKIEEQKAWDEAHADQPF